MLADVSFTWNQDSLWGGVLAVDMLVALFFWIPALACLVVIMRRPAQRLARSVNLALTPEIRKRLNRFLRMRTSLRIILLVLFSQLLLATTLDDPDAHRGQAKFMLLLPAGVWISSLAASLWPRWKSRGAVRMAHLRRLHLKDTVTRLEVAAIALAYALVAALAGWALWYAGTPWRRWFWVPAVLLAGQAAISLAIGGRVMNAPAAGRDSLELAWDDVLRFGRVRSLLISSSIVTLSWIAVNAADMAKMHSQPAAAVLGVVGAALLVTVYRSPARNNWRRAWPPGQSDVRPFAG